MPSDLKKQQQGLLTDPRLNQKIKNLEILNKKTEQQLARFKRTALEARQNP